MGDVVELTLKISRVGDELGIMINNDVLWKVSGIPLGVGSFISRNDKTLAYWDSACKRPFEAAVDSMMDEVKVAINDFRVKLEQQIKEILEAKGEK